MLKDQLEKLHNTLDLREQIQKAESTAQSIKESTAQSIKTCTSMCRSSRLSLLPEQPLLADRGQHQEGHTALKDHLHLQVLKQRTAHLHREYRVPSKQGTAIGNTSHVTKQIFKTQKHTTLYSTCITCRSSCSTVI